MLHVLPWATPATHQHNTTFSKVTLPECYKATQNSVVSWQGEPMEHNHNTPRFQTWPSCKLLLSSHPANTQSVCLHASSGHAGARHFFLNLWLLIKHLKDKHKVFTDLTVIFLAPMKSVVNEQIICLIWASQYQFLLASHCTVHLLVLTLLGKTNLDRPATIVT